MKLAEALLLRSEYQNRIFNIQERIMSNLKVQEDDEPYENPEELLQEAFELNEKLCELIKQINAKNNTVRLSGGQLLSEALADRDMIMKKRSLLASIAAKAVEKDYRLTRAEIKMYVVLPVGDIQKQIDTLSRKFRELDTEIQGVNWTVDL